MGPLNKKLGVFILLIDFLSAGVYLPYCLIQTLPNMGPLMSAVSVNSGIIYIQHESSELAGKKKQKKQAS